MCIAAMSGALHRSRQGSSNARPTRRPQKRNSRNQPQAPQPGMAQRGKKCGLGKVFVAPVQAERNANSVRPARYAAKVAALALQRGAMPEVLRAFPTVHVA